MSSNLGLVFSKFNLRMNKSPVQRIYQFADFRFDAEHLMLYRGGESIPLAPKAAETLLVFIERRGQILSKEELIEQIWPDASVEESNLFLYLSVLRKTLGNQKDGTPYLETLRRRGYRFNGSVHLTSDNNGQEPHSTQVQVITPIDSIRSPLADVPVNGFPTNTFDKRMAVLAVNSPESRRDWPLRRWSFAAVGVIAIVTALALGYSYFVNRRPIDSIAVMPFVNESGDPDLEYLADGLTETLIDNLTKIPGLQVKASSSVFHYKGKDVDATTIGKELNVQTLLFGKVVQHGEDIKLDVELVDARTQNRLWEQPYKRKMSTLMGLLEEFERDLVRRLRLKLSGAGEQNLAKNYTENDTAYKLYLKGLKESRKLTPPEMHNGIEYLQQAIENDPSYALAYATKASAHISLAMAGEAHPRELVKAKSAALKAVEIDDNLAEGHSALAYAIFAYDWSWAESEKEFRRALELSPNNGNTHRLYADFLGKMGRREDGRAHTKRALEIEPLSPFIKAFAAWGAPHDEGLEMLRSALEIEPGFYFARLGLARKYRTAKKYIEAIEEARLAKKLSPFQTYSDVFLASSLIRTGKRDEARAILDEMLMLSRSRFVPPYHIARVYNELGDKEQALKWLEKAYQVRDPRMTFLKDLSWKNVENDPRFQDILRRVGF